MTHHRRARRDPNRAREAAKRQAARNARTDRQQLDLLAGRGHGQCAEAERLWRAVS